MTVELEHAELEKLYKLAIAELGNTGEQLTVWAGGDSVTQQDPLIEAFRNRFPEIPLDLKVDLSKIQDLKIHEELLNGNLTPDVTMLQTSNDFDDWKKIGVLEAYKPEGFENIYDGFKDPEGYFSAYTMIAFLPQYAKEGLKNIPTDIIDMISDEYKDKMVLAYPHDDDAVLYVYDHLLKKYGVEFIQDLAKLNPVFARGTAGPPLLVGEQGYLGNIVGYQTGPDQASQSFIPKSDFFISWGQRIAMFKLTKHKACARLFLAYVQSLEFQQGLGNYSVRKDIDFGDTPWIGSYENTNPTGFYEFMRDRKHIGELRALMQETFGPVHGLSPVEDYQTIKLVYGDLKQNINKPK